MLRAIDPSLLRARYTGPASEVGERPELQWVKISRLRIDPRYQREIGRRGAETQRPNHAGELLDQLVRGLDSLKPLGLEVRTQRGIGRQLVDLS